MCMCVCVGGGGAVTVCVCEALADVLSNRYTYNNIPPISQVQFAVS